MAKPEDMTEEERHIEFRKVGFTGDAWNHPHTQRGFLWLCTFNGITPEQAPWQFKYASSAYMQAYIDARAANPTLERLGDLFTWPTSSKD